MDSTTMPAQSSLSTTNGALIARTSLGGYVDNLDPGTYYATHRSTAERPSDYVNFVASKFIPMDDAQRLNCKITNNAVDGTCGFTCSVASTPPSTVNNACPRLNRQQPWFLGVAVETSCGNSDISTSPTGLPFEMFAVTNGQAKV